MNEMKYEQLNETVYHEKLENGLDVYLLPKQEFNKTFVTFTTKYGSIDREFIPLGKDELKIVPDGIAHFLEHKMFEKEDGDVFQQFSTQGAQANAFTSFTRTAYLFSSTDRVLENVATLLKMVQEPYFTEKTVEKEKGIIGQEIQMYNDNPDWRLYFGTIENMYHTHPVKIDIAGTIDSIADITADLLYECYHTFYHPSNMLLFAVGNFDPKEMMEFIRTDQKNREFVEATEIVRHFEEEPASVAKKNQVIRMNVEREKCYVGIKLKSADQSGKAQLKHELSIQLLLDVLFSKSSLVYEKLYEDGVVDDSFSFDFSQEQGYGFAIIGGDTDDPDNMENRIKDILLEAKKGKYIDEQSLERAKKKRIGRFLRSLNSPEYIANQFTRYAFNEMSLFEVVPTLEKISFEDIEKCAAEFFDENQMTSCHIARK